MERGKITWTDKIVITRDEVSKRPKVVVEGLWSGKDRTMINRALHRLMRLSASRIIQKHKKADLIEERRLAGLEKARKAKKLKKLEEEKNNVRGQQKSNK